MKQAWHRLPPVVLVALGGGTVARAQETGLVESAAFIGELDIDELDGGDDFGRAVAILGDLDGDGVREVAVGAPCHYLFSPLRFGAVFVISLDARGDIVRHTRIAVGLNGFDPVGAIELFGAAVAAVGDLDGDGITELAVNSSTDIFSDGEPTVWILFLDRNGAVKSFTAIGDGQGGFPQNLLDAGDNFGGSIGAIGDLNDDGVFDIVVGATGDDDGGGIFAGAVWILFMRRDGTVGSLQKISETQGGFGSILEYNDYFGRSVAGLGDWDGDGVEDIAVGSNEAVWLVLLHADGTVKSEFKLDATSGPLSGALVENDGFGSSVASAGDADGDGIGDLLVGASSDDRPEQDVGAVWLLLLRADGTIRRVQKFGADAGGLDPRPDVIARFGASLALLPDDDGDGAADFLVGASSGGYSYHIGLPAGEVWTLHLGRCADPAVAGFRNPGGTNPASLLITPPIPGDASIATIDLSLTGHLFGTVLAYLGPRVHPLRGGQVLLLDGASPGGELFQLPLRPGPIVEFVLPVPETLSACGLRVSTQALQLFGTQPFALSNAIDLIVGY